MQLGVCASPDQAPILADAGFDYIELNVQRDLIPEQPDGDFQAMRKTLDALPLPCPAANCFLPGHLKPLGPAVDEPALTAYVDTACARARAVGIGVIVFGSGGARRLPEGFPPDQARAQLVAFGRMAGGIAQSRGVVIALEHLNATECNIITSVAEGDQLVREVNHPNFQLLVDSYHWGRESEPVRDIIAAGGHLVHAHIATPPNREAPGLVEHDFGPFLRALKEVHYNRRLSIEARMGDLAAELPRALAFLREELARHGLN